MHRVCQEQLGDVVNLVVGVQNWVVNWSSGGNWKGKRCAELQEWIGGIVWSEFLYWAVGDVDPEFRHLPSVWVSVWLIGAGAGWGGGIWSRGWGAGVARAAQLNGFGLRQTSLSSSLGDGWMMASFLCLLWGGGVLSQNFYCFEREGLSCLVRSWKQTLGGGSIGWIWRMFWSR